MVQRPVADAPLLRTRVAAAEGAADAVEDADVCERVASIGIGDQSVRSLKYRRPERWLRMAVSNVLEYCLYIWPGVWSRGTSHIL